MYIIIPEMCTYLIYDWYLHANLGWLLITFKTLTEQRNHKYICRYSSYRYMHCIYEPNLTMLGIDVLLSFGVLLFCRLSSSSSVCVSRTYYTYKTGCPKFCIIVVTFNQKNLSIFIYFTELCIICFKLDRRNQGVFVNP